MVESVSEVVHVQPGAGPAVWVGTSLVTCKAVAVDTQGRYSLFESRDQPHSGPPMHIHHHEDESYYILEGEYDFHRVGLPPLHATAGSFVYVPIHMAHTYTNVGDTPGRMVVVTAPAGLERFFLDVGQPAVDLTTPPILTAPPDLVRMAAIGRKYELEIVGPPPR
jgi:mannose-6-phosphate isomerase-like protein (cupin superfamily)